jgi:hypothetical protein
MVEMDKLEQWIGHVGYVKPDPRQTATVAVKILGVKYAYGSYLLVVAPLAGTGKWQVNMDRVSVEREGELEL